MSLPAYPSGGVAFLRFLPITLKALKPKETDLEPRTIGDHVRKRRLQLGLTQMALAEMLRVRQFTVIKWEKHGTTPPLTAMARIIKFLGYDPIPSQPARTLRERMRAKRRQMGWSMCEAARQLGVARSTWRYWETCGVVHWPRYQALLERFLREEV